MKSELTVPISEKVLSVFLKAKGIENPEIFIELLEFVDNRSAAVEKLLGIYEQPELPKKVMTNGGYIAELESFNALKNRQISATGKRHSAQTIYGTCSFNNSNTAELNRAIVDAFIANQDKDSIISIGNEKFSRSREALEAGELKVKDYNTMYCGLELRQFDDSYSIEQWLKFEPVVE